MLCDLPAIKTLGFLRTAVDVWIPISGMINMNTFCKSRLISLRLSLVFVPTYLSRRITKPTKRRAPSEDSYQTGHPPSLIRVFTVYQPGHLPSLIRVFAVCMKEAWVLSYPLSGQWRLWSDWADAQADLSFCWAHMPFFWFSHEVPTHIWRQS